MSTPKPPTPDEVFWAAIDGMYVWDGPERLQGEPVTVGVDDHLSASQLRRLADAMDAWAAATGATAPETAP